MRTKLPMPENHRIVENGNAIPGKTLTFTDDTYRVTRVIRDMSYLPGGRGTSMVEVERTNK